MLFAASESSGLGAILVLGILALGAMKIGTWIGGSDAVKGEAKKGLFNILGQIFRK